MHVYGADRRTSLLVAAVKAAVVIVIYTITVTYKHTFERSFAALEETYAYAGVGVFFLGTCSHTVVGEGKNEIAFIIVCVCNYKVTLAGIVRNVFEYHSVAVRTDRTALRGINHVAVKRYRAAEVGLAERKRSHVLIYAGQLASVHNVSVKHKRKRSLESLFRFNAELTVHGTVER